MIKVKLQYGVDTHNPTLPPGTTIGSVLRNASYKAILGYGDNVKALVNGVEQPDDAQVSDGITIVLETRANSKAV
jgi:hypothetical protein